MIRYYKTLRGLRKAYGGQVSVRDFFDRKRRIYRNGKDARLQPTKELKEKVARAFAEQVYTWKGAKENFVAILMSGGSWLDWSLFQCFYVEQGKKRNLHQQFSFGRGLRLLHQKILAKPLISFRALPPDWSNLLTNYFFELWHTLLKGWQKPMIARN